VGVDNIAFRSEDFKNDVLGKLAMIILKPDNLADKREAMDLYEFVQGLEYDELVSLYMHLKDSGVIKCNV
jgi:hypothetical protein